MNRTTLGAWGEAQARRYLEAGGYSICAVNWRCAEGEVDLIARADDILVFVEVKTRRSAEYGAPQEAVGRRKARHLVRAAERYLEEQQLADVDWRVDVIAITAGPGPRLLRLEHIRSAVEGQVA